MIHPRHLAPISRNATLLAAAWGLLLWVLAAGLATWSIDFGDHWDEPKAMQALQRSAVERDLLPSIYYYPSLMHDVGLHSMLPEIASGQATTNENWTPEFRHQLLLRARRVSAWFTLFAIVAVSVVAQIVTRNRLATLIAPLFLAGSFEYFYHARWLAPDGYLATLGILSLAALVIASQRGSTPWLLLGSGLAGLACGAKYPGGILLLPAMLTAWQLAPTHSRMRHSLYVALTFTAAFLISTPGAVLDPTLFSEHVTEEIRHYATGHRGYTVSSPAHHLARMAWYLVMVFPSQTRLIGLTLAIPMLWGGVILFRSHRKAFNILGLPSSSIFSTSRCRRSCWCETTSWRCLFSRSPSASAQRTSTGGRGAGSVHYYSPSGVAPSPGTRRSSSAPLAP